MYNCEGKVTDNQLYALITGISKGIGYKLSKIFTANQYH
jgi:short-subunit dehydrogenase